MRVLKFGGSSVSDAGNMSRVLDIVEAAAAGGPVVLVSSAISGCTDSLVMLGRRCSEGDSYAMDIIDSLKQRHSRIILRLFTGSQLRRIGEELDAVFAQLSALAGSILSAGCITPSQEEEIQTFGELLSTRILAAKLRTEGFESRWIDSRDLVVKGNQRKTYSNIRRKIGHYRNVQVFVAPGFVARDADGAVTTLGRGGSDYSAALYAAALGAPSVEIWTDVPGIMTANPKVVPQARNIPHMSYDTAFCMASHGAKVLYAPTVEPAREKNIPIRVLNTFAPAHPGTVIDADCPARSRWVGVSSVVEGDMENVFITFEGEVDVRQAQLRGVAALKDAGIWPLGNGTGESFVYFSVLRSAGREACVTLHSEFL